MVGEKWLEPSYYGGLSVYRCLEGHVFGVANTLTPIPCSHCPSLAELVLVGGENGKGAQPTLELWLKAPLVG